MSRSNTIDFREPPLKSVDLEGSSIPLPTRLIQAALYRQPPGRHPGQTYLNDAHLEWQLEKGKELIELVTGGRGWVKVDGDWQEVTPGALLWHVAGDQTIARSDWDNPYQCLAIAFETNHEHKERRTIRLAWWQDLDEVERFARELIHWHLDDQFDRDTLLYYAYGRLLFQSQLWQRAQKHSALPPKLRHAVDLMTQHCTESYSLHSIAKEVGWSVPHLHEVFRAEFKESPHQFILNRRIKIARERLAITDDPIKLVASECGFSSTAAFCHTFRSRMAITPLAYRKQQRDRMKQ